MDICETADDTELDISWLEEEEKLLDDSNYHTQRIAQIRVVFFYLDKMKKEVHREHIIADLELSPQNNNSKMSKDTLYSLIQTHKRQYKLLDIQCFHLPLGEDNIQAFSASHPDILSSAKYLKNGTILKDFIFEPSVKLLHEYSEIYVFYVEEDRPAVSLKSILKLHSPQTSEKNIQTKKVRILADARPLPKLKTNRFTRKHK